MSSKPDNYEFFSDVDFARIIQCVLESPKSANDISKECNIPLSTVYRKLKKLREHKLLQTSGIIDDAGVKIRLFNTNKKSETKTKL